MSNRLEYGQQSVPASVSAPIEEENYIQPLVSVIADLHGRDINIIYRQNFESYQTAIKEGLRDTISSKVNDKMNALLFACAGVVLLVTVICIVLYLRGTIPDDYVWPGVTKILLGVGLAGLSLGGLFSLAMAFRGFRRASDTSEIDKIVDKGPIVFYTANVENVRFPVPAPV